MYDFIISGAGLTGVLTANVLQKYGYSVFIFDKMLSVEHDWRISAISYGAKNILERFGLWKSIEQFASPMLDIYTASSSKNPFYLHFNAREFMSRRFDDLSNQENPDFLCPLAYTVPNFALQKVLYNETICIHFSLHHTSVINSSEKVIVILTDGRRIEGKIFICAEGKNSLLRSSFKIPTYQKKYLQYAITCSVSHKREHQNTAQEIFFDTPFALLPLKDPCQSSLIFTVKADFAHLMLKLNDEEFIKILNKKCHLEIDGVITRKSIFPLSLTFALKYSDNRVLFIGDTIHSIHPVAGQGFNLTIYDLSSLINNINSFGINSEKYKYIFSKFYHERFCENLQMALFTDGIIKLFSVQNSPVSCIRNIMLSFINSNNFIKDFFIKKAIHYEE